MNLKLTGDRILVRPTSKVEKSEGGIIIPNTVMMSEETSGEVVAVGSGPVTAKGVKLDHFVQVGDTILFSPYVGQETDVYGERLFVMKEEDVLAVVDKE